MEEAYTDHEKYLISKVTTLNFKTVTAADALKQFNWDLEAAIDYLLNVSISTKGHTSFQMSQVDEEESREEEFKYVTLSDSGSRMRTEGVPVGLKKAKTSMFNCLIQNLFMIERFAGRVLKMSVESEDEDVEFLRELQVLFSYLTRSHKKSVSSSKALKLLKPEGVLYEELLRKLDMGFSALYRGKSKTRKELINRYFYGEAIEYQISEEKYLESVS